MSGSIAWVRLIVRRVRYVLFWGRLHGRVTVGERFVIGPGARAARGSSLKAGNRVNIAADFVTHVNLVIGDDVMISSRVAFIGNDHSFADPRKTIQDQDGLPMATAHLGGDNLIGFGSIIVGNVTIGRGTIVGAGSVVTKDLPEDAVCVGAPARPIRKRR